MLLRKVRLSQNYRALQPRKLHSSYHCRDSLRPKTFLYHQHPSLLSNTNLWYHILTDSEHSSGLLLFCQLHEGSHAIHNFPTKLFNGLQQKLRLYVPKEEICAQCSLTSLSLWHPNENGTLNWTSPFKAHWLLYRMFQQEKSILWEMIVVVILTERVQKNICPVLNGWEAPETPCIRRSVNIINSFCSHSAYTVCVSDNSNYFCIQH
jgi:hypothetical protein